jgi:hypothetical protein
VKALDPLAYQLLPFCRCRTGALFLVLPKYRNFGRYTCMKGSSMSAAPAPSSKAHASAMSEPSAGRGRFLWIRAGIALLATVQLALILLAPSSGAAGYSRGFAPPATGLVGVLLCVPLSLLPRSASPRSTLRRSANIPGALRAGARVLACLGAPLLLWASGGLIFDALLLTGATGNPADIDIPGAASRFVSTISLAVVAGLLLRGLSRRSFSPGWLESHAHALGWWTAACALPYPGLKFVWFLEGKLDNGIAPAAGFPFGEFTAFAIALGGALVLVRADPRRIRPWLLLVPGYAGACLLMTTGCLSTFGAAAELLSGGHGRVSEAATQLVPGMVYFSWLLLGIGVWCCARVFHLRSARVKA